jgi:hypothetical protein
LSRASVATARASSVLLHPGGPYRSTPRGGCEAAARQDQPRRRHTQGSTPIRSTPRGGFGAGAGAQSVSATQTAMQDSVTAGSEGKQLAIEDLQARRGEKLGG